MQDILLADSDWEGVGIPIPLTRNFTVTGNSSALTPDAYPVFDLGFIPGKIRLGNNVNFTIRHVILRRFRYWSHNVAPGMDFLAPCLPGDSALLDASETLLIVSACYPPKYVLESAAKATRPDRFPGVNTIIVSLPQPDCRNKTFNEDGSLVQLNRRCWPQRGICVDYALLGSDFLAKTPVPNGYIVRLHNTGYLCEQPLPEWCLIKLGPVGCWAAWIGGTRNYTEKQPASPGLLGPAAPGAQQQVDSPGATPRRGIILGCVLGGAALVTMILLGTLIVLRRRGGRVWWRRFPTYRERPGMKNSGGGSSSSSSSSTVKEDQQMNRNSNGAEDGHVMTSKSPHLAPIIIPDSTGADGRMPGQDQLLSANFSMCDEQTQITDTGALGEIYTCDNKTSYIRTAGYQVESPPLSSCKLVSTMTPMSAEVYLDIQPHREVKLLPRTLGKGTFGKVVEGEYMGQRVAVKMILDGTLASWGLAACDRSQVDAGGYDAPEAHDWASCLEEAGGAAARRQHHQDNPQEPSALAVTLLRCLIQEVEVLGRCQHPNVVRLLAACLTPPRVCLVMELMDMSLADLMYANEGQLLPMETVLSIALDVAHGMEYLHPTIVHRDLKPANVLVKRLDNNGVAGYRAKLSDFGLARLRNTFIATMNPDVGTPEFMAPELFDADNTIVTDRADVFSFGVLLWSMLTGMKPWQGEPPLGVAVRVHIHDQRLPLDAICIERQITKLNNLMQSCWQRDPLRRPAAAEIVKWLLVVREQMTMGGMGDGASSSRASIPLQQ